MRGSISRINIFLSFVLVVFSFASCSGQSKLLSLTLTSRSAGGQPSREFRGLMLISSAEFRRRS